ncbi:MSCRAMM family protein [Actinophytocola oryzae]|uniref:Carboxypeptidase family protein n=1 Tax=Actinophytocola oryzae TaxID=502181 RepID=A0A4R7VAM6_9PSEU|nr:carboxypeptidase-like regulatory domain-containing protein [Actinophytocola oryzae]TDV46043.1 carboxypeptidase family protein [Actinophytocola oryzae]
MTHSWPVQQDVGTSVTGRVHGALRPLPATILTLTDRTGAQVARGSSGPNGEFQFAGLAPGSYVVIFSRTGYQPHAEVVVPSAVPLDVTLEPVTSVHGTVHDRDTGRPVGAATVTAVGPGGEVVASTESEPDGTYRVTGIDADAVTLVVAAPGADALAVEVDLDRATEQRVDLALDTFSTLTGTVTVDGRPVEHLHLALYGRDGRPAAATVTDHTGAYRFERVKAGQYTLASIAGPAHAVALASHATTADVTMTRG